VVYYRANNLVPPESRRQWGRSEPLPRRRRPVVWRGASAERYGSDDADRKQQHLSPRWLGGEVRIAASSHCIGRRGTHLRHGAGELISFVIQW